MGIRPKIAAASTKNIQDLNFSFDAKKAIVQAVLPDRDDGPSPQKIKAASKQESAAGKQEDPINAVERTSNNGSILDKFRLRQNHPRASGLGSGSTGGLNTAHGQRGSSRKEYGSTINEYGGSADPNKMVRQSFKRNNLLREEKPHGSSQKKSVLDLGSADKMLALNLVTPVYRQKSTGQLPKQKVSKHKCIDCAKCINHDQDYVINKKEGDKYLLGFPVQLVKKKVPRTIKNLSSSQKEDPARPQSKTLTNFKEVNQKPFNHDRIKE